jgi:hypothetical protein
MKTTRKTVSSAIAFLVMLVTLAFASCVRDLDGDNKRSISGDEEALVTLSLSVPGTPASRTITATTGENTVNQVDVLLFTADDDKFYYRAIGTSPATVGPDNVKTFTAKLPLTPASNSYRVVVLANARAAINASTYSGILTPATIATGTPPSRLQVLGSIVMTTTAGAPVTGDLPMWGYEDDVVIDDAITVGGNPVTALAIDLTRAVARVDVSLSTLAQSNFELTSVHLYNRQDKGSVAPAAVDGAGYNTTQWLGGVAIAPNVPAGSNKESTPVLYNASTNPPPVFTTTAVSAAIYTFEALAGTDTDWANNPCLVIGGEYTKDGTTITTYYRVDFHVETPSPAYLKLLRNHGYDVVVQEVKEHGWPSAQMAYENKPSNIVVTITPWNDGALNDIVFNGQSYLAVDKSRVTLYKEGYEKTILVTTNYRLADAVDSWTIELDAIAYPWLAVSPTSYNGAAGEAPRTLTIGVKVGEELGTSDPDRTAHFFIVAGNLRKRIDVVQENTEESDLIILDEDGNPVSELVFGQGDGANPPAAKTFLVKWLPSSIASVDITATPGSTPFVYNTSTDFSTSPVAGTVTPPDPYQVATFTVQPTAITTTILGAADPFTYVRSARVDFSTGYRMVPLQLRQVYYAFETEGVQATYLADETVEYSFTVKSNSPWEAVIEAGDDPDGIIEEIVTASGGGSAAGQPFKFRLTTRVDPVYTTPGALSATVTFKSPDGLFPDETVTIVSERPYLTVPASYTVPDINAHDFTVSLTTNIPLDQLEATIVTSPSTYLSLLSPAFVLDGTTVKLQFHAEAYALTVDQTYVVEVTYGSVTRSLNVVFVDSRFEIINGKKVTRQIYYEELFSIHWGAITCPSTSRLPNTEAEATWLAYVTYSYISWPSASGNWDTYGYMVKCVNWEYSNGYVFPNNVPNDHPSVVRCVIW